MTGRRLALVIGNSEYEDITLARLTKSDADVHGLVEVLKNPEVGGFDEVTPLVNQPSNTVRREISQFFAKKMNDDLLVLYFSGHGVKDDLGRLYLMVKDTEHTLLAATAIPAAFITDEMDHSRSRRLVLILDCCHSGAFAYGTKGTLDASVGTAAAFEGSGYGRVVLTASDATQYAWEGDQVTGGAENSVFTHFLTQGLRTGEADVDADGRITLDELYDYVYKEVVSTTSKQTPGKWSYKEQGEIVIAQNPHPVVQMVELPLEVRQAIESPLPSGREGAVSDIGRLLNGTHKGLALAAKAALEHLVHDDSRRVSIAATEALATYTEARPSKGEPLEVKRGKTPPPTIEPKAGVRPISLADGQRKSAAVRAEIKKEKRAYWRLGLTLVALVVSIFLIVYSISLLISHG